jgi:hypothetical protein
MVIRGRIAEIKRTKNQKKRPDLSVIVLKIKFRTLRVCGDTLLIID